MPIKGRVNALQWSRQRYREATLLLRAIEDRFQTGRPSAESIRALLRGAPRLMVEGAVARASLVKRRSSLFGVLAALGLMASVLLISLSML